LGYFQTIAIGAEKKPNYVYEYKKTPLSNCLLRGVAFTKHFSLNKIFTIFATKRLFAEK
jgi:hypothetical protein